MKIIVKSVRFGAIFLSLVLFICLSSHSDEPQKISLPHNEKLSLAEQKELATKLFEIMVKTDQYDLKTFIDLYNRVIEKCPGTIKAQISLWRLSNLYLFSGDKPDYGRVVELMEHLVARYPDSSYMSQAKQRLLHAYEETGSMKNLSLFTKKYSFSTPRP